MAKSTAPKQGKSTPWQAKVGKSTPVAKKAKQPQHPARMKSKKGC